jgi:multiple sugar transport system ATP-binding protein
MASIEYQDATRMYPGTDVPALLNFSLQIADGEFVVLVGPSGAGKSTALRALAGLEPIDRGQIVIGGRDVTHVRPRDRDVAMVFQNYALYPHMTVAENIGYHLRVTRRPKAEISERVRNVAKLLDLEDYMARKPAQLSGGQRQRVAMGRAIVRAPKVFLMDEPLSNLDAKLRVATRAEIAALQQRLGVTTVYVTHDQVEAMTMGDRVAVLADGRLQQCDTPRVLFDGPVNAFVAGFIGSPAMNLIDLPASQDVRLGGAEVPLTPDQRAALRGRAVTVGVRAEGWDLVAPDDGAAGVVALVEELGSDAYVYLSVQIDEERVERIVARIPPDRSLPRLGDALGLRPKPSSFHLFDTETGDRVW